MGRRPSGALHSTGFTHSIELAAPLLPLLHLEVGSQTGAPQVNSTVSSIELSFLCLDSIESGGRAGASGLGTLPPSLRVVFSFPWLERRGSVRLLGREPPWSGEKRSTPRECGTMGFFFLLEEPETFFSKL
ncbi:unnamed protein product [Microthlaspi erraticum]|uniref:Uncharacterized protein n=1 Tax=Microthlaspi erraticum TaxID=1685480 RepID=A0A6D2JAA1_9BRAS|nr:unnamed protein product [Microthlaspi erraticum]